MFFKIVSAAAGTVYVIVGCEMVLDALDSSGMKFLQLAGSLLPYYAGYLCFGYAVDPEIVDFLMPPRGHHEFRLHENLPNGLPPQM